MSRTCDILFLNMFEWNNCAECTKLGMGGFFVECDEWWGVGLVGLHKTVRGEVRVLAGDGVVKSRTS